MSYVSLHKSQLLDSLENQVLYADLCTVIIGDEGFGKSFLLQQLNQRMQGQIEASQIEAADEMSVAQLEKSIGLQLDLSWSEIDNLIDRVSNRFDRRVLLTVDNAQLLPNTCLEYLMMLVAEQLASKDVKIFVVLAGDARLAKKLNETSTLANNPNICVVFELEPIQQNETRSFIAEFQDIDEGTVEALYDEQKLDYFWQLSKGVPGDLNYQLNRWITENEKKVEPVPETSSAKKYLLGATYLSLAIILVFVLIYQNDINQFLEPKDSTQELTDESLSTPQLSDADANALDNNNNKLSGQSTSELNVEPQPEASLTQSQEHQLDSQSNEQGMVVAREPGTKTNNQEADNVNETTVRKPTETAISDETTSDSTAGTSQPDLTKSADSLATDSGVSREQASNVVKEIDKNELPSSLTLTSDEQKLLAFDDSQFTLQWVGVSTLQAASQFRNSHPLRAQMSIFRRKQDGKTMFLVVSGQFNSRIDADNARRIYQQRSYPGKPWIKSVPAIKKEIDTIQ